MVFRQVQLRVETLSGAEFLPFLYGGKQAPQLVSDTENGRKRALSISSPTLAVVAAEASLSCEAFGESCRG